MDIASFQQRRIRDGVTIMHAHGQRQWLSLLIDFLQRAFDSARGPEDSQRVTESKDLAGVATFQDRFVNGRHPVVVFFFQRGQLRFQFRDFFRWQASVKDLLTFDEWQLQRITADPVGRGNECPEVRFCASEDTGQCVVVLHREGIKLVIVTTGTRDGVRQHRASKGIDLLINDVGFKLADVRFVEVLRTDRKESRCDQ